MNMKGFLCYEIISVACCEMSRSSCQHYRSLRDKTFNAAIPIVSVQLTYYIRLSFVSNIMSVFHM
jgi:hypothetical protein